jgi:hypothetical protein
VIAQVNPSMPRTLGNRLPAPKPDRLLVEVDEPLARRIRHTIGEVERAIGRHVAALVPDGRRCRWGSARSPGGAEALGSHRDLSLHRSWWTRR